MNHTLMQITVFRYVTWRNEPQKQMMCHLKKWTTKANDVCPPHKFKPSTKMQAKGESRTKKLFKIYKASKQKKDWITSQALLKWLQIKVYSVFITCEALGQTLNYVTMLKHNTVVVKHTWVKIVKHCIHRPRGLYTLSCWLKPCNSISFDGDCDFRRCHLLFTHFLWTPPSSK